jgi:thiol-disulfide isomerase/thioredoxin
MFLVFGSSCNIFIKKYENIPPDFRNETILRQLSDADFNYSFADSTGKKRTLKEFKGKVIFINHWATWCGPCIKEIPKLKKLTESVKSDTVVFLFITNERREIAERFFKIRPEYRITYFINEDKEIPVVFKNSSWPTTYIINKSGSLVFKHAITADWSHKSVFSYLQKLQNE